MKLYLKDLMKDYCGKDAAKLEMPDAYAAHHRAKRTNTAFHPVRRRRNPMVIPAALIRVLAIGSFVLLRGFFFQDSKQSAAAQPPLQTIGLPAASPTPVPPEDSHEDSEESMYSIDHTAAAIVTSGCYGNLILLDGSYYTLTDQGPSPLKPPISPPQWNSTAPGRWTSTTPMCLGNWCSTTI